MPWSGLLLVQDSAKQAVTTIERLTFDVMRNSLSARGAARDLRRGHLRCPHTDCSCKSATRTPPAVGQVCNTGHGRCALIVFVCTPYNLRQALSSSRPVAMCARVRNAASARKRSQERSAQPAPRASAEFCINECVDRCEMLERQSCTNFRLLAPQARRLLTSHIPRFTALCPEDSSKGPASGPQQ